MDLEYFWECDGKKRDTADLNVLLKVKWLHEMMAEMWAKWKQNNPLPSLLSKNNKLQFRVAPHVAVVWQPMWKQEGCIKRERSQWESREGQCGEGATQVLTLSGVQRLVVFADSLSQPCHCSSSVACTSGCPTPPVLVRLEIQQSLCSNWRSVTPFQT